MDERRSRVDRRADPTTVLESRHCVIPRAHPLAALPLVHVGTLGHRLPRPARRMPERRELPVSACTGRRHLGFLPPRTAFVRAAPRIALRSAIGRVALGRFEEFSLFTGRFSMVALISDSLRYASNSLGISLAVGRVESICFVFYCEMANDVKQSMNLNFCTRRR